MIRLSALALPMILAACAPRAAFAPVTPSAPAWLMDTLATAPPAKVAPVVRKAASHQAIRQEIDSMQVEMEELRKMQGEREKLIEQEQRIIERMKETPRR